MDRLGAEEHSGGAVLHRVGHEAQHARLARALLAHAELAQRPQRLHELIRAHLSGRTILGVAQVVDVEDGRKVLVALEVEVVQLIRSRASDSLDNFAQKSATSRQPFTPFLGWGLGSTLSKAIRLRLLSWVMPERRAKMMRYSPQSRPSFAARSKRLMRPMGTYAARLVAGDVKGSSFAWLPSARGQAYEKPLRPDVPSASSWSSQCAPPRLSPGERRWVSHHSW